MRVILCDDASERSKYSEFIRDIAEKESIDIDLIIIETYKRCPNKKENSTDYISYNIS